MQIPNSFKELQRRLFQDKQVAHRPAVEVTGSLGSISTNPGGITAMYAVNFQIIDDAVLAQEWGLVAGQDAFVTCSDPMSVTRNDYIQYSGKVYKIIGILERDSHVKLMLKLTQEQAV